MSGPEARAGAEHTNPLLTLIDLARRARVADSSSELGFLVVNDTHRFMPYRQAALWFRDGGVKCLSGVVQVEAHTPYVQWLQRLCQHLDASEFSPIGQLTPILPDTLAPEIAVQWNEWFPRCASYVRLSAHPDHPGSSDGLVVFAHDDALNPELAPLIQEWLHTWHHAWLARFRPHPWSSQLWRKKAHAWWQRHQQGRWWQRRPVQIGIGILLALLFPVRLTVLAPGELVPSRPAVIRAPLDGVIAQFHVRPNEMVKANQPLFGFDEGPLASRVEVAQQALAATEAEYRQQAQLALTDPKSKAQLSLLLGKMAERRAEAEYLSTQFQKSHVLSPQDGVAIFDDPSEWIGRPVQTGERVMKVAAPHDVEIEAWIPIGDAITLDSEAAVDLYLASMPLSSLSGQLRYLGHDAVPRPDGVYAYRLRAKLDGTSDLRIGLKGTAKVHGPWVPLVYWVMRRPLAAARQFLAW